jgi:hypothetical protein
VYSQEPVELVSIFYRGSANPVDAGCLIEKAAINRLFVRGAGWIAEALVELINLGKDVADRNK